MRITVDREACEGIGMCESMAHRFFEIDDDDVMQVLDDSPTEGDRSEVAAAVASCPVQALALTD